MKMDDCIIVGGGAIGLSLAYELATHGVQTRVLERGEPGREASWAGAGILPPAQLREDDPPEWKLVGLSNLLHARWHQLLLEETGVDSGYRVGGGIYLARDEASLSQLHQEAEQWRQRGIEVVELPLEEVRELEPELLPDWDNSHRLKTYLLPQEAQIRNPRHLKALRIACLNRGVRIDSNAEVLDFEISADQIRSAITNRGVHLAGKFCITSGAWSSSLLKRFGIELEIKPIRGQIVLLNTPRPVLKRIINVGLQYLVPRIDGRLIIGSTVEDVGFNKSNTPDGVAQLLVLARSLVPSLRDSAIEGMWSGLRPKSLSGNPVMGPLPGVANGFVATGHFRSGLQLSTGTAVVMRELLCGEVPSIDLKKFAIPS